MSKDTLWDTKLKKTSNEGAFMTNEERDNFLMEAMGVSYFINFSTSEGFFKLWNYIKEKDWFDDFLIKNGWFRLDEKGNFIMVHTHWVNPDKVADAVYKFLNNFQKGGDT